MNHYDHVLLKIIQPRLFAGTVLELGPGGLWPGLTLVKNNPDLELKALGYTPQERAEALAASVKAQCRSRVKYLSGPVGAFPLPDHSVDVVISFGALHTWQQPAIVLNEIARVLKVEGEFFIGDIRQDAPWWTRLLRWMDQACLSQVYRSRKQALTLADFRTLVANTRLEQGVVIGRGPDIWAMKR